MVSSSSIHPHRRFLLVTNDLGPRAGGIETFILGLIDYLDGRELVIYTSAQEGSENFDEALSAKTGAIIYRDKTKVLLPTPRVNRAVSDLMKKYESETVWFGAAMPLAWMSGHLRRSGAKKIVALTHGHEVWWAKILPFKWIFTQSTKNIDVLTYLGDFTKRAMSPVVAPTCALVQIAPGISISHFTPGDKNPELVNKFNLAGKKVIVSVGRLVHRKGQDKLIEALPAIVTTHPDVKILFVGTGPRKAHLDALIKKNSLQGYAEFAGRVEYSQLPKYFRLGDLFVMPSRSRLAGLEVEGLGIVYLEASASGIPVLAGASGGAPDAVVPGITGEVVDGKSAIAIATAINNLLNDMSKLQHMGAEGRKWADATWSWDIWGKRFAKLLELN